MWDTISDWFVIILKCIGYLYLAGAGMAILRHFYVKKLNRQISDYLNRKIKWYQTTWVQRNPVYLNTKNIDICASILCQLFHAVEERKRYILYHVSIHRAIFIRTTVFLPFDITDVNVYYALDHIKQKFYGTYGTYLNGKDGPRNDIKFEPITKDGQNLGVVVQSKSLEQIVDYFQNNPIKNSRSTDGFSMVVTMSIVTDRSDPKYDFLKHCN